MRKNDWPHSDFFCLFFTSVRSDSCRSCFMRAASRGQVRFQKAFKKSQLFENLNDADIISIPMFATCKVKMERNYFVHEKSQIDICFLAASFEVWWEFLTEATPIIITLMPMFATSRAKMEHSILFVKIVNRYFERQRENFVLVSLGEFFVHVTITNVCVWLVKNLFWLVNQTSL